jgi:hypothetical protein
MIVINDNSMVQSRFCILFSVKGNRVIFTLKLNVPFE